MKKIIAAVLTALVALLAVATLASCDGETTDTSTNISSAVDSTSSTPSTFKPTASGDNSAYSNEASGLTSFTPYDSNQQC